MLIFFCVDILFTSACPQTRTIKGKCSLVKCEHPFTIGALFTSLFLFSPCQCTQKCEQNFTDRRDKRSRPTFLFTLEPRFFFKTRSLSYRIQRSVGWVERQSLRNPSRKEEVRVLILPGRIEILKKYVGSVERES